MPNSKAHDLNLISSLESNDAILKLGSDKEYGLSNSKATERSKSIGLNILATHKKSQWWNELLVHFKSPLIIILLVAATISYAVSETLNASIIILMV
jgi:magnesium-transporting ATPase (P-type)